MKKRLLKTISVLLVGVFMLSGCGENKEKKKNVNSVQSGEATAVNPLDGISFYALSAGEVQAEGWLRNQLVLLAENMAADFESISPTVKATGDDRSGWLGGTGESWERSAYYVRGLVSLGYTLNDEKLKKQAQKWLDWTLESQSESGLFGPYANNEEQFDDWAVMPMLLALEEYYDASGDERVIPFLQKYFKYQSENIGSIIETGSWAYWRACDNIYAVWWLWNKTGDDSLKDLCIRLEAKGYKWSTAYRENIFDKENNYHIVNIHQALKLYPTMYALTGKEGYLTSYYEGLESLYISSVRQDGMSNGDEYLRGNSATYGTETCAVAERILSDKISLLFTKDPTVADSLENVAYNCLPQQLLSDGKGYAYFTMQNQIDASLGSKGFLTEYGTGLCYGTPSGCPCCAHNYLMAWPEFVQSMWMKTSDNGLAVGSYGPNTVTADLGDKGRLTVKEETNYPYEETVKLTITPEKDGTECPLYLRIPEWCEGASLKINGKTEDTVLRAGEYVKLLRGWKSGDTVELVFPMSFKATFTENNSVSIKYGAVLFAVKIDESKQKTTYTNNYNKDYDYLGGKYLNYNITAVSDWNFALKDFNFNDVASNFTVSKKSITDNMSYEQSEAPIVLTAKGIKVTTWCANSKNVAEKPPVSPVTGENLGESSDITLIPYAFSRLRITMIPWTGSSAVEYTADKSYSDESSISLSGIIVPDSSDYDGRITFFISYQSSSDLYLRLYINKSENSQILNFKKGENTIEISYPYESCFEKNNLLKFETVDGSALPEDFTVSVMVG